MDRVISGGDEGRGREGGRRTFEDTLQRGCGGSQRGGRAGGFAAPDRQQAEQLRSFVAAFLDILRALSDRFGGGQSGGDGAGPIIVDGEERFPVEPDGGIGDGAGPPEATTLAIGEEDGGGLMPVEPDGGIGDGAGPIPIIVDGEERFPVEPDGGIGDGAGPPEVTTLALGEEDGGFGPPELINVQELPGGIPFNDIARYGKRGD